MALLKSWRSWAGYSTNRRIFSATITVSGLTLLVRIAEALIYIVVAYLFGRGDDVDAFIIAYLVPSFAINVIAGALNAAIMPTFIEVRDKSGMEEANRLFQGIMTVSIGMIILISLAMFLSGGYLIPLAGSGFNEWKLNRTLLMFNILIPVFFINCITKIWATIINSNKRFALVAFIPAVKSFITIALLISMNRSWGIYAFAIGMLLGSLVEAIVLAIAIKVQRFSLFPRWHGADKAIRKIANQFFPMVLGACLMGGTELIDQSMAAMIGKGSVSALSYANKIVMFILIVGSGPLATAIFPYFSQMAAANDLSGIKHTLQKFSRLILSVSIPLTIFLIFTSGFLVEILFERGTFKAEDTQVVSRVLLFYLFQIPFYVLGIMGVRLLSAFKKNHLLMLISLVNLTINVIGNYVFMQYFGVAGISLSTSLVYMISMMLIFISVKREFKKIESNYR